MLRKKTVNRDANRERFNYLSPGSRASPFHLPRFLAAALVTNSPLLIITSGTMLLARRPGKHRSLPLPVPPRDYLFLF